MIQALVFPALASAAMMNAPTSGVRLDLIANVPVACSSAVVSSTEVLGNGLLVRLDGACNTDHVMRVWINQALPGSVSASLNGAAGESGDGLITFRRAAFFGDGSTLSINVDDPSRLQDIKPSSLIVEIAPY